MTRDVNDPMTERLNDSMTSDPLFKPQQYELPVRLEACPVTGEEVKPDTFLRCENLTKAFRHRKVVNSVDVQVQGGEVVGLLGPNGAGKTTIFYMIVGLLQPNGGKIFLNGEEITSLPMYQRARKGVGYLPQEPSVFRKLSVEGNLMAILETLRSQRKKDRSDSKSF